MKKRIEEQWIVFKKILPADAGEAQIWDMQVAFYAGALCLHHIVLNGVTDGDEVNPEDLQLMEDIHTELKNFHDRVKVHV